MYIKQTFCDDVKEIKSNTPLKLHKNSLTLFMSVNSLVTFLQSTSLKISLMAMKTFINLLAKIVVLFIADPLLRQHQQPGFYSI